MIPLIESRRRELEALCQQFGVTRLDLFGSAVRGDFDPARSDLDFVVDLPPSRPIADFFGLKEALEALFDRPVDLLTDGSIRNPYRRARIEAERTLVYAR
jgi:uncharacterized protein